MEAMSLAIDPVIGLTCRLLTALIFGSAALGKIRNRAHFTAVLRDYQILPTGCVAPAAAIVIAAEGFVTLAIWFPPLREIAAGVAVALLVVYALAIALTSLVAPVLPLLAVARGDVLHLISSTFP